MSKDQDQEIAEIENLIEERNFLQDVAIPQLFEGIHKRSKEVFNLKKEMKEESKKQTGNAIK